MPSQSAAAHLRIDEGLPRQQRKRIRADARNKPRTASGTFAIKYSQEQRQAIIAGVPDAILNGQTTSQYAQQCNIPAPTLRAWIIGNEFAELARGLMLAHELMVRAEDIDTADDPLTLARAREGFRAWSWIAERREARLYGPKQEVTHQTADMSALLQAVSERLLAERQLNVVSTPQIAVQHEAIEADLITVKSQVIDNT